MRFFERIFRNRKGETMTFRLSIIWLLPIVLLVSIPGIAQSGTDAGSFADISNPLGPPGPQKTEDIWAVDRSSGAVTVKIPIPTTPGGGRGPAIPYYFEYSSNSMVTLSAPWAVWSQLPGFGEYQSWLISWTSGNQTGDSGAPKGPWVSVFGPSVFSASNGETIPYGYSESATCTSEGPYLFADRNGQIHDLNLFQSWLTSGSEGSFTCGSIGGGTSTSGGTTDGSEITAQLVGYADNGGCSSCEGTPGSLSTLIEPDGTTNNTENSANGYGVEDANGNYVVPQGNASGAWYLDSLGRTIATTPFGLGSHDIGDPGTYTVATTNASGGAQTYVINIAKESPSWNFSLPHPTNSEITVVGGSSQIQVENRLAGKALNVISSIALPDGRSYSFSYDPVYGTLSQINFPTGGNVRFVWGVRGDGYASTQDTNLIVRAESTLVVKDVYLTTGSSTSHWSYFYPDMDSTGNLITNEGAPDGTQTSYIYSPYTIPSPVNGATIYLEAQRLIKNSSGNLVESASTTYSQRLPFPAQVATTYYDGSIPLQKQVQYSYDSYGNVTEKDESDFYACSGSPCSVPATPPGGWLRQTFTQYAYQNAYQSNAAAESAALLTAHIVDKPSRVLVTDGSGNPASLTFYAYDEAGRIGSTPTGLSTHDDQNYGLASTLARGDLTTETRCITISGAGASAACGTEWQTSYYYDLTGQLTKKIEGSNTSAAATTTYTWGGQGDGYLQNVQGPLGLTDSYTYYSPTGQVEQHTDWNLQPTKYYYDDNENMGRPSEIIYPDEGSTSFNYDDSVPSIQTTIATGEASGNIVKTAVYDGLGRLTETQLNSDPGGEDKTDTAYDNMGRVYSVSNPYRGTAPSYFTYDFYDNLGRLTKQTNQDNLSKVWSYAGNQVTLTDEDGNQWTRTSDGLGRLTQVLEPNGSSQAASMATNYTYDPLGDLLNVTQLGNGTGSISRGFSYDSLGRLVSASNPETGTTGYTYSVPGQVCAPDPSLPCTKTDARSVTTNFSYDALSRLLSKTYSGNVLAGTLSSCFQFDTASNGKGRLGFEWTQPGNCPYPGPTTPPTSGYQTLHTIVSYDFMGRITNEQRCMPGSCTTSQPAYSLQYSYDLTGKITSYMNGNDSILYTNTYNAAGQVSKIESTLTGPSYPTPLFSFPSYSPAGGLSGATYGTGTGITSCRWYDTRLRVTGETDTSGPTSDNPACSAGQPQ